jgi:hypothetical protein
LESGSFGLPNPYIKKHPFKKKFFFTKKTKIMKKILFISLFISFKMFGQTPKIDVVVGDTENVNGIRAVLKPTNPTNIYTAITGENNSTNGNGYGVRGFHSGSGSGVFGGSISGVGVYGESAFGGGVSGFSAESSGVYGSSDTGVGGQFTSSNSGYALKTEGKVEFRGLNGAGTNKFLKSTTSNGNAEWSDLLPYSQTSTANTSLLKITNNSTGNFTSIEGFTNSLSTGLGISGISLQTNPSGHNAGVKGENLSTNAFGYGVFGKHSGNGTAMKGLSDNGIAGSFESSSGYALQTSGKIRFGGNNIGTPLSGKILKASNSFGDLTWSNLLPLIFSENSSGNILEITNTNTGNQSAIVGKTNTTGLGSAITGECLNAAGIGIGVYGYNAGTGNAIFGWGTSGSGIYGYSESGNGGSFSSESGKALVTNTGKVGIGNTTPNLNTDERMEINGRLRIRDSTNTAGVWFNNSANGIGLDNGAFYGLETAVSGSERAGIWIGSAWRFYINRVGNANFTGTVTATGFPIASDFRFKKNIQPLENTLSKVQKIVGVSYDLRKDEFPEKNFSDKPQIGFIAQDIEKIFPEMVFTDEKGYKSVDYARLTPVLVEALKELTLKNQTLENKNQTLESRLDKIEAMLYTIQPNTENLNSKK